MTAFGWSQVAHFRKTLPGEAEPDCRNTTPQATPVRPVRHHRTIFISDIHLGTRGSKAEQLLDFLAHNRCETLYVIGDLIDGWRLKHHWYWPESHSLVLQTLLRLNREGTKVVYIPGNHDEFLRPYCGHIIAGIAIEPEVLFENARGQKFLVLHGDRYDSVINCARWLAKIGDLAYVLVLTLNERLYRLRRALGLPYWSVSAFLKHRVKRAVEYVSRFERTVAQESSTMGIDGVICGHIHQAEIRRIGKIIYHNDGDWVESCTALVEDALGNMEILHWAPHITASHLASAGSEPAQEAALIPV